MESGVTICSVCSSREAQYTCICQFPLPQLCASAECPEIHTGKKSAYFHYFLPISASDFVTARNHLSIQQRVLALHHTQSRLISSLSLLDTAVMQIDEAYQRQVAALAALKDQYIAKVNQLKEAATEAFNSAVAETTRHAVNADYTPQSEIAKWIWTMANKAEIDDIPPFQTEIRERETEKVEKILALKVIPMFQSLAPWSINFSAELPEGSEDFRKSSKETKDEATINQRATMSSTEVISAKADYPLVEEGNIATCTAVVTAPSPPLERSQLDAGKVMGLLLNGIRVRRMATTFVRMKVDKIIMELSEDNNLLMGDMNQLRDQNQELVNAYVESSQNFLILEKKFDRVRIERIVRVFEKVTKKTEVFEAFLILKFNAGFP